MHYYQFNIGDYTSHTARLSLLEDLAYRRLIDLYYLNEAPFTGKIKEIARDIGMLDHLEEVEYILNKYFPKSENEWVNKRASEEIRKYHMKKKTASKAGKASGKIRQGKASERVLNSVDVPLNQPLTNNHKPLTNNQETIKKKKGFSKPSIEEIKAYLKENNITSFTAEHFFNHYETNGWMRGKNKIKSWKACVNTWKTNNSSNKTEQKTYGAFPV